MELVIPVDPVAEAIKYLEPLFPDVRFAIDVPSEWDWDQDKTLAVVVDAGGRGIVNVVFDDVFLMVEVSNPNSDEASRVSRETYARLKQWGEVDRRVSWISNIQRPTYTPDEDTKVPAFTHTLNLRIRCSVQNV